MKYLNDYTEDAVTVALRENGAFFAFSNEQFARQKSDSVEKYVSLGSGLICPKENAVKLIEAIADISDKGMKKDLEENGKEKVILRELYNHEAFYTCDLEDTINFLAGYGIEAHEVHRVYADERAKQLGI